MNCIKHTNEKISLINIHPDPKTKRLLCLDCYVEALESNVPKEWIISINELLQNPKLLFSLQQAGYGYFHVLQDQLSRKVELQKYIVEIKDLIQTNVNNLFKQLDQYMNETNKLFEIATQMMKKIWESIEYQKTEKLLQNIIQSQQQSEDESITEELNKLFAELKIDEVGEIKQPILNIKQEYDQMKDRPIPDIWEQVQLCFKQALQIFIQTHNKMFNGKLSKKIKSGQLIMISNYQKHFQLFKQNLSQPYDLSTIYKWLNKQMNSNFEIQLVETYTEFQKIDLRPKDVNQMTIITNTIDKISVGFYKPAHYQSNALLLQFNQSAVWEQISKINQLVKRRESFISDIFEYQIGNNFLIFDNSGQTTFLNMNNKDFFNEQIQKQNLVIQANQLFNSTSQIQQNPAVTNFFNQFISPSSQQNSNQQSSNPPSQIRQIHQLQFTNQSSMRISQVQQQVPSNNLFPLNSQSQLNNRPQTGNQSCWPKPTRMSSTSSSRSNNNYEQQLPQLFTPLVQNSNSPLAELRLQQQILDQSANFLKLPLGVSHCNVSTQTSISFKANLIQIYKVIPTYL